MDAKQSKTENEIGDVSIVDFDEMNPIKAADILLEKMPNEYNPTEVHTADNTDDENDVNISHNSRNTDDEDESNNGSESADDKETDQIDGGIPKTRSGRHIKPPSRLNLHQQHLITQSHIKNEYTNETQCIIAIIIHYMNNLKKHRICIY